MPRCVRTAAAFGAALAFALPAWARPFPANALRGDMAFVNAATVQLNGHAARLAPGARVRAANNQFVLPSQLAGRQAVVNFTVDNFGLVKDVWILTDEERARQPWPSSPDEAARWRFDPARQTWSKP